MKSFAEALAAWEHAISAASQAYNLIAERLEQLHDDEAFNLQKRENSTGDQVCGAECAAQRDGNENR